MHLTLATKITLFRIVLIPLLLLILLFPFNFINTFVTWYDYSFYLPHLLGILIFISAAITDAIDGHLARTTNTITNLGKFLDPIADKLLVNSLLIYLTSVNLLPAILTITMISRDIIVDALRLICLENKIVIAASPLGKFKTVLQMITIPLLLLVSPFVVVPTPFLTLSILTTLVSLYAGIDYLYKNIKQLY